MTKALGVICGALLLLTGVFLGSRISKPVVHEFPRPGLGLDYRMLPNPPQTGFCTTVRLSRLWKVIEGPDGPKPEETIYMIPRGTTVLARRPKVTGPGEKQRQVVVVVDSGPEVDNWVMAIDDLDCEQFVKNGKDAGHGK